MVTTLWTYPSMEGEVPIASDGTDVYWAIGMGLQVASLDGGAATVFATKPNAGPMVVDDKYVYWMSAFPSAITRSAKH